MLKVGVYVKVRVIGGLLSGLGQHVSIFQVLVVPISRSGLTDNGLAVAIKPGRSKCLTSQQPRWIVLFHSSSRRSHLYPTGPARGVVAVAERNAAVVEGDT